MASMFWQHHAADSNILLDHKNKILWFIAYNKLKLISAWLKAYS